jgi:tetratricopeptide (TPR) repeat protein
VQPLFEKGVAMLHSFWFTEAETVFKDVIELDPSCAIAYWGVAVNLLGNSLAYPPPAKSEKLASEAVKKGREIGAKTQRERDWIEAIGAYYRDFETVPVEARLQAYEAAMKAMAERYPRDDEVRVYYALAMQAAASPSDTTYSRQRESAKILEEVYARNPSHPGAAHYLIHAYDFPPLAEQGLPAANRYASIAPAAPHARHMPSHIYTMLGLWKESIASNFSAIEIQPEYYHALDFAVYAYLQMAQDGRALELIRKGVSLAQQRPPSLQGYKNSVAAMPARYALERGDWKAASSLPITKNDWPYADSLTRYARGVGMARSGDLESARSEIAVLRELQRQLEKANESYWAERVGEEVAVVAGWIEQAKGNGAEAEKLIRGAADSEDAAVKKVSMENLLYPMREWLAELLLIQGQPEGALREYEIALAARPNRFRGLYGGAKAAESCGKRDRMAEYLAKLRSLTSNADARPELAFLAISR